MPRTAIQPWRLWRSFCELRAFSSANMATVSGEVCTPSIIVITSNINIRCFPHVINISVQTVVKELKENLYDPVIKTCKDRSGPSRELMLYAEAVQSNPVGATRDIVSVCRKSGHRRVELQQIIKAGNKSNAWGGDIRTVQLLKTRWSLTFNMVDWVIELWCGSPSYHYFCTVAKSGRQCNKSLPYIVVPANRQRKCEF